MAEDKRWGTEELSNYIKNFSSEQKESVVKELVASKILSSFLDTVEGRLILDSTIESIRDNVMGIVRECINGDKNSSVDISQRALQINVAYNFMYGIATIMTRGENHEKKMEK